MRTTTTTEDGSRYTATVAALLDPGYDATAVMLGQAALVLLSTRDGDRPGRGGVLTPAVALGDELVGALRAQAFTLEVDRLEVDRPEAPGEGAEG